MEVAALTAQRESTDEAVAAFNATAASVRGSTGSAGLVRQIDGAVGGLSDLTTAREAVDGAALAGSAPGSLYSNVIVAVSAIDGEISRSASGSALAADLADLAALAQAKETTAQLAQLGATIVGSGVFEQTDRENLTEISQSSVNTINRVGETLGAQRRAAVRDAVNSQSTQDFNELIREINRTPNGGQVDVELTAYLDAANGTLNDWRGVETAIAEDISAAGRRRARRRAGFGSELRDRGGRRRRHRCPVAWFVARSITRPLGRLTDAAYDLSNEKLPRLVEQLRSPNASVQSIGADIEAIDVRSSDEIGQLGEAFNAIQQVTVDVADEQAALLRRGISDIFVNLARRNQALLDRQIEFIDQLEANEEDPDQLENLFRLDHLATRMRRNAESLLVLAGAEPTRRRGRPVPLTDVVRVAIGEVEDFARISLLALDDHRSVGQRGRRPGPSVVGADGERDPVLPARHPGGDRRPSDQGEQLRRLGVRPGHRHERRAGRRGQRSARQPAAGGPDPVALAGVHGHRPFGLALRHQRSPDLVPGRRRDRAGHPAAIADRRRGSELSRRHRPGGCRRGTGDQGAGPGGRGARRVAVRAGGGGSGPAGRGAGVAVRGVAVRAGGGGSGPAARGVAVRCAGRGAGVAVRGVAVRAGRRAPGLPAEAPVSPFEESPSLRRRRLRPAARGAPAGSRCPPTPGWRRTARRRARHRRLEPRPSSKPPIGTRPSWRRPTWTAPEPTAELDSLRSSSDRSGPAQQRPAGRRCGGRCLLR